MNWFQKHLNWTAVLSWIALYPINFVVGLIVGAIVVFNDPYISEEALSDIAYVFGIVVSLAWLMPTNGWILRKKSRSLWNLLWLFIPFGGIVFLCLKNLSDKEPVTMINVEKEKHEIWTIYYREFASADPRKQPELQWRINEWQRLMKQGLSPREAYKTSRLLDFNAYLRKEYDDKV